MNRHSTLLAKDNLVVVFVISNAADGTTSIFLSYLGTLMHTKLLDISLERISFSLIHSFLRHHWFHLIHLVKDFAVLLVVSSLLTELNHFQKVCLQLAWVVNIHQKLIIVLGVPLRIFNHILHKARINSRKKVLAIQLRFFTLIKI